MLKLLVLCLVVWVIVIEIQKSILKKKIKKQDMSFLGMSTVIKWMENKNKGFNIGNYLLEHGYKRIAIYGLGDIGKLLYEELKETDIKVVCFSDRNYESMEVIEEKIKVVSPDNIKDVDVVVVTPMVSYDEIVAMLGEIDPKLPTLSLRDIMFEIKYEDVNKCEYREQ